MREIQRKKLPGIPTREYNTNLFKPHLLFGGGSVSGSVFFLITVFNPVNILTGSSLAFIYPFLSTILNSYCVFAFLHSRVIHLIAGLGK